MAAEHLSMSVTPTLSSEEDSVVIADWFDDDDRFERFDHAGTMDDYYEQVVFNDGDGERPAARFIDDVVSPPELLETSYDTYWSGWTWSRFGSVVQQDSDEESTDNADTEDRQAVLRMIG